MRFRPDGTFEPEEHKARGPGLHVTCGVVSILTILPGLVLGSYFIVSAGPFVGLYLIFGLPLLIAGFFAVVVALWSLDENSSKRKDYRDALNALPYPSPRGAEGKATAAAGTPPMSADSERDRGRRPADPPLVPERTS